MRFAFIGEGLTDFPVLRNLLVGFFDNKDLPVTRLLPKSKEPVGWSNVLKYISTDEFREAFELNDYIVIQIDTKECEDWGEGIKQIGDNETAIACFIDQIVQVLIKNIGKEFYEEKKERILFAVSAHEIECWLLPFHAVTKAHQSKMVGCWNALEQIAKKRGFSLNQKNYQEGKHYDELSIPMKNRKVLMEKYVLNPSLRVFVENQLTKISLSPEAENS